MKNALLFPQKLDRSTAGIALRIARRLEEDRRARKVYASVRSDLSVASSRGFTGDRSEGEE